MFETRIVTKDPDHDFFDGLTGLGDIGRCGCLAEGNEAFHVVFDEAMDHVVVGMNHHGLKGIKAGKGRKNKAEQRMEILAEKRDGGREKDDDEGESGSGFGDEGSESDTEDNRDQGKTSWADLPEC